jgi:hypothetical protein
MDREKQLRLLEEAERQIVEGERHIAEQELIVVELDRDGHDVTEARRLLKNFYATQNLYIEHRNRIARELEQ